LAVVISVAANKGHEDASEGGRKEQAREEKIGQTDAKKGEKEVASERCVRSSRDDDGGEEQ